MKVAWYKFCYWLGVKLGIMRLEAWAYLHWFKICGSSDIMAFFAFADSHFRFCRRWGIKSKVGK